MLRLLLNAELPTEPCEFPTGPQTPWCSMCEQVWTLLLLTSSSHTTRPGVHSAQTTRTLFLPLHGLGAYPQHMSHLHAFFSALNALPSTGPGKADALSDFRSQFKYHWTTQRLLRPPIKSLSATYVNLFPCLCSSYHNLNVSCLFI